MIVNGYEIKPFANLEGADLEGANLKGADIRCSGDMRYIKTIQLDTWYVGYTYDTLQIGCQRHSIEKWKKWDTPAGREWISAMDTHALLWAKKYLDHVLKTIELSPAKKP